MLCLRPTVDANICPPCSKRSTIEAAWVVSTRDGALKVLINRYKFHSATQAASVCGDLLDTRLPLMRSEEVTIVPVPTAPAHRRIRGFDHTARIAKELASLRNMNYSECMRRTDSTTQHFKNRSERLRTASKGLSIHGTVPKRVLLVDDIYTTGATIQACAAKLREAGVKRLYVAVIARQTLDDTSDL